MFSPTACLIDAFVDQLQWACQHAYPHLDPPYTEAIIWSGRLAMEIIGNSDALYHNIEHTIMVTLVGQEILTGKNLREQSVSPCDWVHFMISLLCHDIGYVRGVCRDDRDGFYTTGTAGTPITLPPGATDAALTPYHVDRGKLFVHEHFDAHPCLDADLIAAHIERTRFPVPRHRAYQATADYPGLARAADIIGQLADPHYPRKFAALFHELEESGLNAKLGYKTPADLRDHYPVFYWQGVHPYLQDALQHLQVTHTGRQWIANLQAHVFAAEHHQL